MPTQLEVLTASITGLLNQLAALPLPSLVADVQRTVQGVEALVPSPDTAQAITALTETATRLQALVGMLETRLDPLLSQAEATLASTEALLGNGDHVLVTDSVYGPTRKYCSEVLARYGVETTFYDPGVGAGIEALFRDHTRLVFLETPGSLTFDMGAVWAPSARATKQVHRMPPSRLWPVRCIDDSP